MEIFVFNKTAVSSAQSKEPHAFISIADVGAKHPPLIENEFCCGILRLQFDDVDIARSYDEIPPDVIAQYKLFTVEHAQQIKDFVNDTNPEKIIVHCNMGLSRSPAVMAALYEYYGEPELAGKVFHKYQPNMYVFRTLYSVLHSE